MSSPSSPSEQWVPLNENHAIDVAAVVVTFIPSLPDRLLSKALAVTETAANDLELTERVPQKSMQWVMSADGTPVVAPTGSVQGQEFNSVAKRRAIGLFPDRPVEQLSLDQASVDYKTWNYVSWPYHIKRIRDLMTPCLELVSDVVSVAALRLEYLDRFRFDGQAMRARPSDVLKQSTLVAPHIFERIGLWHSHTGAFLDNSAEVRRLLQVNVDCRDVGAGPRQPNSEPTRWIDITTARENRSSRASAEQWGSNDVFAALDAMHSEVKMTLEELLTEPMIQRISLRQVAT